MHMVRHDHEVAQQIPLAIEVPQTFDDFLGQVRTAQHTRSVAFVEMLQKLA